MYYTTSFVRMDFAFVFDMFHIYMLCVHKRITRAIMYWVYTTSKHCLIYFTPEKNQRHLVRNLVHIFGKYNGTRF